MSGVHAVLIDFFHPINTTFLTAKAQKPIYSILIYDEIRAMDPPGRFLKQDPKTKLWSDIGKKKALDKTRQALREGAPEMLKEMGGEGEDEGDDKDEIEAPKEESSGNTAQARKRRDDNPMNSSFMSNLSIGSFSIDGFGLNESMKEDMLSSYNQESSGANDQVQSAENLLYSMTGGTGNRQDNNLVTNVNQTLITSQMQLLQQQMEQLQQVINLQNMLQNSGTLDPNTQLQLLNLQLQLQNQITQQQSQQPQQNQLSQQQNMMFLANNMSNQQQNVQQLPGFNAFQGNLNQGANSNAGSTFAQSNQSPSQLNNPNIAALLSAIHNNAASQNNGMQNFNSSVGQPSAPQGSALEQFRSQMMMQNNMNQQINSNTNQIRNTTGSNDHHWDGGNNINGPNDISSGSSNINDTSREFTVPLNDEFNQDQIIGMTMSLQDNERKPGGTSYARSQRIGLKNSFTRRPNSHRQLNTTMANSLMSLESLNLDDVEEMNDNHGD